MSGINADGDKLLLGRGKIYFGLRDPVTGESMGERFLGECGSFEVSGSPETRDKYTNTDKSSGLLKRAVIRQTWEFSFEMNEYDPHNCALAFLGTVADLVQAGGAVSGEAVGGATVGVQLDVWYQLANRSLDTGTPLTSSGLTEDVDFIVDYTHGRILFPSTGSVTAGTTGIQVDYTANTVTYAQVIAGTNPLIEGKLVFIGDNVVGPNYHFEAWRVQVAPDGALGLISDDYGSGKIKGSVLLDADAHADAPYFQAVLIPAA